MLISENTGATASACSQPPLRLSLWAKSYTNKSESSPDDVHGETKSIWSHENKKYGGILYKNTHIHNTPLSLSISLCFSLSLGARAVMYLPRASP